MTFPGVDLTQGMRKQLAALLAEKRVESKMTVTDLAEKLDLPKSTVERRLSAQTGFSPYGELQAFLEVLGATEEALALLFPDVGGASHETSAELKETKLQLTNARDQLDDLRSSSGPELGLVRDLASTGRWAIGVSPHHTGPSPDCLVLESVRLAITPVGSALAEIEKSGLSVREVFNTECGKIVRDRAVFIGNDLPGKPRAPWDVAENQVIYMAIPLFAGDRSALDACRSLPKFLPESIVVLSITQGAWADNVAALIAKTLGWGIRNSASVYLHASPIEVGPSDEFIETMNRYRNDGLSEVLRAPDKYRQTVTHHVGRPSIDGPDHPFVDAASDPYFLSRMPFIVLLSESDAAIRQQALKVRQADGTPRFSEEQWMQWRDDLRHSVETLPAGRSIVVDVDLPNGQSSTDGAESVQSELLWQRTAKLADGLLDQLTSWGGARRPNDDTTGDRDALKVLRWRRY